MLVRRRWRRGAEDPALGPGARVHRLGAIVDRHENRAAVVEPMVVWPEVALYIRDDTFINWLAEELELRTSDREACSHRSPEQADRLVPAHPPSSHQRTNSFGVLPGAHRPPGCSPSTGRNPHRRLPGGSLRWSRWRLWTAGQGCTHQGCRPSSRRRCTAGFHRAASLLWPSHGRRHVRRPPAPGTTCPSRARAPRDR